MRSVIRFLRPCQRSIDAIEANLEATRDIRDTLEKLDATVVRYHERHGPDAHGVYRRRVGDRSAMSEDVTQRP